MRAPLARYGADAARAVECNESTDSACGFGTFSFDTAALRETGAVAGSGSGIIFIKPQRPIHSTTTAIEIDPTTANPTTANSIGSCMLACLPFEAPGRCRFSYGTASIGK